jgi:Calcineurin-like phosphoesterase
MDSIFIPTKRVNRFVLVAAVAILSFMSYVFANGGGRFPVSPWSFGVNGDTQWTLGDDPTGANPNYVHASVASIINEQFVSHGVKFVLQVGDITDRAGDAAMYTRANVSYSLYNRGVGFFPLRGNHETMGATYGLDPFYTMNVPAFLDAFPQTRGGGIYTFGT